MNTFQANTTYSYGWIGDSDLKTEVTIVRRTEKSVWFQHRNEEVQRAKIHVGSYGEFFYPTGRYSMAPTCSADKVVAPVQERIAKAEAQPLELEEEVQEVPVTVEEEEARVYEYASEAEVRATMAEEDIKTMEEEGRILIGRTMYGTLTVQRLFGRKYQAVSESIDFTTADRAVFATFLATVYVRKAA